jgi:hypothetical protein
MRNNTQCAKYSNTTQRNDDSTQRTFTKRLLNFVRTTLNLKRSTSNQIHRIITIGTYTFIFVVFELAKFDSPPTLVFEPATFCAFAANLPNIRVLQHR